MTVEETSGQGSRNWYELSMIENIYKGHHRLSSFLAAAHELVVTGNIKGPPDPLSDAYN